MGQYFLIVNPTKRQFLDPHKFGSGLKLMEFSNDRYGAQQAQTILCSNGNGSGGGDLGTEGLTEAEKDLIGSWAGDPIVVAGDYGDPWKWVPKDLKGKTYETEEYAEGTNRLVKVEATFGKRKNRKTGKPEKFNENLYSAARCFFEDISDKMITLIAKGEGGHHPFAAVDLAEEGIRDVPAYGVIPEKEPKQPAGGQELYAAYKANAETPLVAACEQLKWFVYHNPEQAADLLRLAKETIRDAKATMDERLSGR